MKHWNLLPKPLQTEHCRTVLPGAEVQPIDNQASQERIRNWIMSTYPGGVVSDAAVESTQTGDHKAAFAGGVTGDDRLMLFWPAAGEYLLLTREEARTVAKGLRTLFSSPES